MIGSAIALIASAAATPCSVEDEADDHLSDVCAPFLEGAPAYGVTVQGSLIPRPAAQQVLIYQMDGEWLIRISGYRWQPGTSQIETRRTVLPISDEDAQRLIERMNDDAFERLQARPYYGSEDSICTDGSRHEVAKASAGSANRATLHSCGLNDELKAIARQFREVAIKYDPEFDGMLRMLND